MESPIVYQRKGFLHNQRLWVEIVRSCDDG
ncbi:hypothetical protein AZE42_03194 [Rhizopogon vesiculosus]|uniref:Uncharacterized protein n=1 Tax=Rhizopogon vesiculosus TaxID=180088 RepID=A0A1J8QEZ9_9AGAM|nr:hypothetical protein AZE42_03194 [Rhizopogon vesiculosus]